MCQNVPWCTCVSLKWWKGRRSQCFFHRALISPVSWIWIGTPSISLGISSFIWNDPLKLHNSVQCEQSVLTGVCGWFQHQFKLTGRTISQSRMKPFLIIHVFDEIGNPKVDVLKGTIFPKMDFFGFQRLHKAFSIGIVKRISLSAYADLKAIKFELFDIILGCLLYSAIGMMNTTWLRVPVVDGHP